MILTTLAFFCCATISSEAPLNTTTPPSSDLKATATVSPAEDLRSVKPDAPKPKISASGYEDSLLESSSDPATPASESLLRAPIKPATEVTFETPRKRKIWYGLAAVEHGSAAFDAWTTRRAITSGQAVEANPLERPFANSGAIYATTQICPILADYVGRRMMRSSHRWMRRVWWVPQAASASFSLGAGIHNYGMVH